MFRGCREECPSLGAVTQPILNAICPEFKLTANINSGKESSSFFQSSEHRIPPPSIYLKKNILKIRALVSSLFVVYCTAVGPTGLRPRRGWKVIYYFIHECKRILPMLKQYLKRTGIVLFVTSHLMGRFFVFFTLAFLLFLAPAGPIT